jgi:hypothetical protein
MSVIFCFYFLSFLLSFFAVVLLSQSRRLRDILSFLTHANPQLLIGSHCSIPRVSSFFSTRQIRLTARPKSSDHRLPGTAGVLFIVSDSWDFDLTLIL